MSSRLKERGGAGGKIIATKPAKTLSSLHCHQDKPRSQSISLVAAQKEVPRAISVCRPSIPPPGHHGKENPRPISAGRPSIASSSAGKDKPRPFSAGRASIARSDNPPLKHAEKPSAAVLRSTSSFSRGKVTDFRGDSIPKVSSFGERRSFSGFRTLDKELSGKYQVGKNSGLNNEKCANLMRGVTDGCKSKVCLGAKPQQSSYKALKKVGRKAEELDIGTSDSHNCVGKDVPGFNMKLVDRIRSHGVISESHADEVISVEVKHIDRNGHRNETVGSDKDAAGQLRSSLSVDVKPFDDFENKGTLDLVSKSICETEIGVCVDNTAVHKEKDCLNLHPEDVGSASNDLGYCQGERRITSLIHVHHRGLRGEAIQFGIEAKGNDGVEVVKDFCTANRYQSNLHEKLALLEDKVQKIALEIKQTKDMLDKNKTGKSTMVLSDIQKKIFGVEKAVDNIKDGAKFEFLSSDSGKSDHLVDSNLSEKIRNSLPSIKSSDHEELEARFFPHHKLMRNRHPSVIPAEQDKHCELACSRMNGGQEIEDGLSDENPIALEFLASLREEQHKPKNFDVNTQFTHGMAKKMQPENTLSGQHDSGSMIRGQQQAVALESNEKLEEIDTSENNPPSMSCLGTEESTIYQLSEIGRKVSTGGWFVSGGEAVLLAHDDNSCSYYDISNSEVKSEYKAPAGFPSNLWGDCWLIRAPGIDGCSGQYVVAASAGNALEAGFCSWDFYTKDVKAFRVVEGKDNSFSGSSSRTAVASMAATSSLQISSSLESQSCWCRPCGPLLISTSSRQKVVSAYDIRDGDLVMTWEVNSPVAEMEYSSPLQWRSRGKVIIAEREAVTLWDVNSLNPQPILSVPFAGKKIYSLHVNNTDAEIGAGVRQRASSTEVEGNDGVLCTQDSVHVFDFRIPSGVGLNISRHGANALSIFSRGDSILLGSTEGRLPASGSPHSLVEHFSLRKASLVTTYLMPEFDSHYHHSSITQVWGNSNIVMGICGMGLFVFDAFKGDGNAAVVKETIGPDDLFRPTFDYMDSRVLVISRDRPAFWKYLL